MKYRNIVVSGDIGTGSTTLAKALAKELGFEYVSVGELFRKLVKENNLPLVTEVSADWDYQMEKELKERLQREEGLVVEGHYQGWNARDIRDCLKILLKCSNEVALNRAQGRSSSHSETSEQIEERKEKHRQVFRKRYGNDDFSNEKFFDLVIDNTNRSVEDTVKEAIWVFNQEISLD